MSRPQRPARGMQLFVATSQRTLDDRVQELLEERYPKPWTARDLAARLYGRSAQPLHGDFCVGFVDTGVDGGWLHSPPTAEQVRKVLEALGRLEMVGRAAQPRSQNALGARV